MTVTREAVAPREPFATEPLGGSVDERLGPAHRSRGPLRREDPAAERSGCCSMTPSKRSGGRACSTLRVPAEFGGPGGTVRDVLSAVIQIGRGSSNVAQALRAHFGFSERLLSNRAIPGERAEWFPRVNAGIVVGNAITDAAGRAPVERRYQSAARHRGRTAAQRLQVLLHRHAVRRCHRGVGVGRRRP